MKVKIKSIDRGYGIFVNGDLRYITKDKKSARATAKLFKQRNRG